ncbi:MAG TPA: SDR family NAD(P)-dependent oxidoreductase [Gemmataceae bacterium]|nr:SDR family NAD(P)-dependent oxidoreductase [Gemmataceae bacterium]
MDDLTPDQEPEAGMGRGWSGTAAVVTGASSGIGAALARRLAAAGCPVGLIARRRDRLAALADEIRAAGGTAAVAMADVGDRSQVREAFAALGEELGPVDLLVANAGVGAPTTLDPVNTADVEEMFRVNVFGVVYAIEAVLPEMLRRRQGHIAAVSSLAGFLGLPGESGYCASKAAVNTYLDGLRIHLRGRGIRVTTLCPGFVRTPMTAANDFHMPWLLDTDEAARRMIRALSRGRAVYRFPWPMSLLVRLAGWLPDWLLARVMHDYNENPPCPPAQATTTATA